MEYCELEQALARQLHLVHQAELSAAALSRSLRLSIPATPAYRLVEGGDSGDVACDLYTYQIGETAGETWCRVEISTVEAHCVPGPAATVVRLRRTPIQIMKPWPYGPEEKPLDRLGQIPALPLPGPAPAEDLLALRNLVNTFYEHRLHRLRPLFATGTGTSLAIELLGISGDQPLEASLDDCRRWLESERENRHCYCFLGVTGLPLVSVSPDRTTASGLWMTMLYQVEARQDPPRLRRMLALTRGAFVWEADGWKILTLAVENLAPLPETGYSLTGRYDRCGQSDLPWPVDQEPGPVPAPSDAMEIENLIQGWAYGCRRGELMEYFQAHMQHPGGQAYLHIRSFGASTPVLDTDAQVEEKLRDMTRQYRPRFYTFHAPTTPVLRLLAPDLVLGTWFDCAATNLRSAAQSPEAVPYMTFVNKYVHRFRKIGGRWYLVNFQNEPMVALPDWELDMLHNTGYLCHGREGQFPPAFEEVQNP